jgi:hypothetical protein
VATSNLPNSAEALPVSHPVFAAGGRNYTLNHVIQAADFRGDLEPFRTAWLEAASHARQAEEQGREPDAAALEELASQFRYRRDLITAEECEQWLAMRGLTLDDFSEHIQQTYWASQSLSPEINTGDKTTEAIPRDCAVTSADFEEDDPQGTRRFRVGLLLSDDFNEMARALAWRVAVAGEGIRHPSDAAVSEARLDFLASHHLDEGTLPGWIKHWGGSADWFEELLRLEAGFQTESQGLLTTENQRRALAAMRLPLLRLEIEVLELASEAAAREAFLCASDDGTPLSELAEHSHYSLRSLSGLLEELPEPWQPSLLNAAPGAVLPPFASQDGFKLCRLVSKRDPTFTDRDVLDRVNAAILRAHYQELEARCIRWNMSDSSAMD